MNSLLESEDPSADEKRMTLKVMQLCEFRSHSTPTRKVMRRDHLVVDQDIVGTKHVLAIASILDTLMFDPCFRDSHHDPRKNENDMSIDKLFYLTRHVVSLT